MSTHLRALCPTPLLNTPEFNQIFKAPTPPLNEKGLFYPLEMIALPGTKFAVEKQMSTHIFEVSTKEYPQKKVFLDIRTTEAIRHNTPERQRVLPPQEEILNHLENSLGLPYIWGGNWGAGILEIQALYSTPWSLAGVDCSGLLYEATNGFTPRNTSELLFFGKEVPSIDNVKPLDILVWPGHVIVLLNSTTTIESLYGKGVLLSPLTKRLSQISNQKFIIRRFI